MNPGVPGFSLKNEAVFSHLRFSTAVNIEDKDRPLSFFDATMSIEVDADHT
jgi:hypothetical protein